MQPSRPFQGVPYNDMFTFLPAPANRDVITESPAPTVVYGSSGNPNPVGNAGDLIGKEAQSFVPAFSPSQSSTIREHFDSAKFQNQNDLRAPSYSDKRACHSYLPYAAQSQFFNCDHSPSLSRSSAGPSHESSNGSPLLTERISPNRSHYLNAHLGGDINGFRLAKSQSHGQQMPTVTKVEGSNFNELVNGESQNFQQNVSKPGVHTVSSDRKGINDHSPQADAFSNLGPGDSNNFPKIEGTKVLGNTGGYSLHNLLETNNILQQALRLLSAASGTGLIINQDRSIQGCEADATRMKSSSNPQIQNLSHSSNDGTLSKGGEAGLSLDKTIIGGNEGAIYIDDGLKSECGGLTLAEKLWDGTLRLSSSVSVSAVAFFKSGDWMQDFSWSGSVEVRGKVKLDAFEKYVQDLPRSRSRGVMVMSLLAKEGSSAVDLKKMTEVARKYKDGKRVGIAQLNKGVDMYVCPHSDAVITILAKHGFFKGMSAVKEKSDPLLGCVVWRKNSTSASTSETTVTDAPLSKTLLNQQSELDSVETQIEVGTGKGSSVNKSPELSVVPCIDHQPEQSVIPVNKSTSFSINNMETLKPNLSNPPVSNQSTVLSDVEDLPEYDFGAVTTKTFESMSSIFVPYSPTPESEQFKNGHANQPVAAQLSSENSTVSKVLTDLRFLGQPQNMKHQSEAGDSSMQVQQENQIGDYMISMRPSVQGLAPENMGRQLETRIPSWSVEEKKPVDGSTVTGKPKNLFDDDDDDMPEWSPSDFKRMRTEVDEMPGPSFSSSTSMVSRFSFTDMATGRQLPSPPPLPPLPPPHAAALLPDRHNPTGSQLSLPPPLPPLPPPAVAPMQFLDKNYSTKHQHSLPPPLPPLPPPHATSQVQRFNQNHPTEQQRSLPPPLPPLPSPPAVSQVQLLEKNHLTEHQRSLPPPLPPLPPPPPAMTQVQIPDKNHPSEHQRPLPPLPPSQPPVLSNQCHGFGKTYTSVPQYPERAVNVLMHENSDANQPHIPYSSPAAQLHSQFQAEKCPPPPPLPQTPPPPMNRPNYSNDNHPAHRAVDNSKHDRPGAQVSHERFQDQHYQSGRNESYHRASDERFHPATNERYCSAPDEHYRPTPDKRHRAAPDESYRPALDKRYQSAPDERYRPAPDERHHAARDDRYRPSPDERYRLAPDEWHRAAPDERYRPGPDERHRSAPDQRYRPAPDERYHSARHRPPPVPEKSTATNFMHKRTTDASPRKQFQHHDNHDTRTRSPNDRRETRGSRNEVPPFPPSFNQNSDFRTQSHRHRTNNHDRHSNWRSSRP